MIKRILTLLIFIGCTVPSFSEKKSAKDIDAVFYQLMLEHEKSMQSFFQETAWKDPFEKVFFSEVNFSRNMHTAAFFENIKTQLESGEVPAHSGLMQISYTSISSINGVRSAVSYDYRSDGKNVVLTKGTLKDGQFLQAVYNYTPETKLLETKGFKGKKLIKQNTYKYDI